jgi:hypothetical protein
VLTRSIHWNDLHDRALAVLTSDDQHVSALRAALSPMSPATALVALQDLVTWGVARETREALLTPHGQPAGERLYYAVA